MFYDQVGSWGLKFYDQVGSWGRNIWKKFQSLRDNLIWSIKI